MPNVPESRTSLKNFGTLGAALVLTLLGATGCSTRIICAGVGMPSIILTVVDATNKRNLNAEATVRVGLLFAPFEGFIVAPSDVSSLTQSAGSYELRISAPQYLTRVDTVTVTLGVADHCSFVEARPIEIALARAS